MAPAKRVNDDKAQEAREFALSSHQLLCASDPRASIRSVLALTLERFGDAND